MTEAPDNLDPLEAELRSFRPVAPSRAVFDRVGQELAGPRPAVRPRFWITAGLAAAACVVVATAVWWTVHSYPPTLPIARAMPTTTPSPQTADDNRPDLAAYRRALSRSTSDLDDLLDRHAATVLSGGAEASSPALRLTASSVPGL